MKVIVERLDHFDVQETAFDVEITLGVDAIFVTCLATGVYGSGTSITEALVDFAKCTNELINEYRKTKPEDLDESAKQLLNKLLGCVE